MALELGLPFGLQRHPEQLLGGQAAALVQAGLRPRPRFALASLMDYPQHPAYSSPAGFLRPLLLTQGGYAASLSWLIHNFWLYLRANLRRHVRRILRRHGYPPDKQEQATRTVLEQAEVLSEGWAAA